MREAVLSLPGADFIPPAGFEACVGVASVGVGGDVAALEGGAGEGVGEMAGFG